MALRFNHSNLRMITSSRTLHMTLNILLRVNLPTRLSNVPTDGAYLQVLNKVKPCGYCISRRYHKRNYTNNSLVNKNNLFSKPFTSAKFLHHDISKSSMPSRKEGRLMFQDPDLDWEYLTNKENLAAIQGNILNRKGVGDIEKLHQLVNQYEEGKGELGQVKKDLIQTALDIPNTSHPEVPIGNESAAVLKRTVGEKSTEDLGFQPRTVVELGSFLDTLRLSDVSLTTGNKTYYLKGAFAKLEQALVRYTIDTLKEKGFKLLSVPDLLYTQVVEGCGFKTTGENQVYKLKPEVYGKVCLAGTGEMPLAGFCMNQTSQLKELPQRWMTVSQCYRAETSSEFDERGIYRVHHFTKVEMFGLTANETGSESQVLLDEFCDIQTELFSALGMHFRILEMPTHELGAAAHRKYDMEAWMTGKGSWGEISSCSNCTDYQARRLAIKYRNEAGEVKHVHTVNGTACAVPRMIMALSEMHQKQDQSICIPKVLQPYMGNLKEITKNTDVVVMKPIKVRTNLKRSMKK